MQALADRSRGRRDKGHTNPDTTPILWRTFTPVCACNKEALIIPLVSFYFATMMRTLILTLLTTLWPAFLTDAAVEQTTFPPPGSSNAIVLNFRGAPIGQVLDYLAEAAGFVINRDTDLKGNVDMWSKTPVSRDEAYQLLNSALKRDGYAVTRNGRTLNIISLESAKSADLEVFTNNDPQSVAKSDAMITQIIPVRYANAGQIIKNLETLLPTSATLSANESANSVILVATQTQVRRMLRIIKALDASFTTAASIRVFALRHANAKQLSTVVQQLLPSQSIQGSTTIGQFGGGGDPFGGLGTFDGQAGSQGAGDDAGNTSSKGAKGQSVVATADDFSNSLIVRAAPEAINTISGIVRQLDQPTSGVTELRVFRLVNADPTEISDQLGELFPDDSRSSSGQTSGGFSFGGPGPGRSAQAGDESGIGSRTRMKSRVLSVPDLRSDSLVVGAAASLMPQIARLIEQLDSNSSRKEVVRVYQIKSARAQQVTQLLQDLFKRNNTAQNITETASQQQDPLLARQTQ